MADVEIVKCSSSAFRVMTEACYTSPRRRELFSRTESDVYELEMSKAQRYGKPMAAPSAVGAGATDWECHADLMSHEKLAGTDNADD